jgi:kinesin family protein 3/17
MKQGKSETVKVAVRVRPINALEKKNNSVICVEVDRANNEINLTKQETNQVNTFNYDYVYPSTINQRTVYDETAFPIVEAVIEGYNGTIFAYGQTGCGKTFTMMGDFSSSEYRGIIPNAFEHIFGCINSEGNKKKFLVRCSFLEIYNEDVRDLLAKDTTKKLDIREDPKIGIFVKDLNIIQMKNTKDLENELNKGFNNRHVGETTMNKESSRSHCIFTVYIESSENEIDTKNQKIKAGKLNLVDLAGSERQSKSGVMGERFEEAKKINLSLTVEIYFNIELKINIVINHFLILMI